MSDLGSPIRPIKIKCTSMGFPSRETAYWSIVLSDGRQMCLDVTPEQAALIEDQAREYRRRVEAGKAA